MSLAARLAEIRVKQLAEALDVSSTEIKLAAVGETDRDKLCERLRVMLRDIDRMLKL